MLQRSATVKSLIAADYRVREAVAAILVLVLIIVTYIARAGTA